ncbi:response regulator [Kineosporia succinea]|uniref:CheY-like chemotaxis protein n=1 Tax=Kineosporia succinea TaxID=84632 RepID=A0ABT9P4L9_9ACTN|nr:response regulator [Kineosporia succinea]MDP9827634.1 CheY-like chemotaxis protein [Kineosporia succinea]
MAKVLVVEDDPDNRLLLELRLQRMGHDVLSATCAGEALALIGLHGVPDLAVLDIVMEGIDGLDLLMILRRLPTSVSMPAIMLTARQMLGDEQVAADLNAAFMLKPIVAADLTRAVDAALAA